jgi:hypothetical protein
MKRFSFVLLAIIFFSACSSFKIYQNIDELKDYNFVELSLPQNVLTININISKIDSTPGVYAKYTNEFFGYIPTIKSKSSHFVINNISISKDILLDTAATYYLKYKPAAVKKNLILNDLYKSWHLINDDIKDSIIKHRNINEKGLDYSYDSSSDLFNLFITNLYIEKIDTIRQYVNIDSIRRVKINYENKIVTKTDYDIAKEIADDIYLLRSYYYDLIGGIPEIAYEKATLDKMIDEIKKLYYFYLSYFTGSVEKTNFNYSINVVPKNNDENESIFLFSFDATNGFSLDKSNNENNNFYLYIIPLYKNPKINNNKIVKNTLPARKPMLCKISIANANNQNIIYENNVNILQKGYIYYVIPNMIQ